MKNAITVIVAILLAVSFLGCLNGPSPPGVDLPELIVHHPEEDENETIINVRAMELIMFDEVTLYLNDTDADTGTEGTMKTWTNTFGPEYRTNRSNFDLNIFVRRDEDRYNFNATFELYPDEDIPEDEYEDEELVYRITYYDGEENYKTRDDLPIIEPLNPIEGENS